MFQEHQKAEASKLHWHERECARQDQEQPSLMAVAMSYHVVTSNRPEVSLTREHARFLLEY